MDIGTSLRLARERAGLSREQISAATKIKLEKLEALEENAFDRLPSGVYLEGIIRAYAHEVGLEPEPFLHQLQSSRRHVTEGPSVSELAHAVVSRDRMRSSSGHRRNAAGLTALVALVLVAFAAGGYLYTSSTRPAPTQRTDAAHEERAVGTAGVSGEARPESSHKADPDVAQRAAAPAEQDARDRNITGRWTVATRIDRSRVEAFHGLRLGYVVNLRQDGERVTGDGRKITENGTRLQAAAQTPISVVGTVAGDQLNLTFTERGARRQSTGTFVLRREADGSLRGSFSSNAARSSGAAEARRQ